MSIQTEYFFIEKDFSHDGRMWSHTAFFIFVSLYVVTGVTYVFGEAPKETKVVKPKEEEKEDVPAHLRPTKCQVCRILAQELVVELNSTNDIKKSYPLTHGLDGNTAEVKRKTIDYKYSEIRIMDILESVCKNVYNYRTVAGPDFPYLKGVKSMLRQSLEDSIKGHGLALNLDAPEELVEDPTHELRRMLYQCNQMVEIYEDDIMDWYMHKQDENPLEFLCAERLLDKNEQDCLYASTDTPEGTTPPKKIDGTEKKSLFSYESQHKKEL